MQSDRNSKPLIVWSAVLAACGTLTFATAACFVAVLLHHFSLTGGYYVSTYIVVQPALLALSLVGSAVVLVAALFVRHIAAHRFTLAAKRLSLIAILGTVVGWLTVGAALFWLWAR